MKFIKASLSIATTLVLFWALQTKFGDIPPLGKFLNPATGFWQNAESKHIIKTHHIKLDGLQGPVNIVYDENMVPHVFAQNDNDLYFAQGYVTAQDRLWQMDIQTRSASGRLSEVVGAKALDYDRYSRRMGMMYGAENTLAACMKDPKTKAMLYAYTAGVNAYIHSLPSKYYPIEFKLIDYAPEEFKPINCALVLKLMSETLAGGSDDFDMTNTLKYFGDKITNELFPDYPFKEDPILPTDTKWNFKPLPIPAKPKSFLSGDADTVKTRARAEGIGSNNWVVNGSRTASGYPLLANDPHLNLTFPSIWYQIQLSAPGLSVYGVSIPGTPTVIIGYNKKVAWGVTNVDADVLDWYQIRFKDLTKNEYWYNNKWVPVSKRIETINIRGAKPEYDTVLYTHVGPVVYPNANVKPVIKKAAFVPVGDALRWIAHDPSTEFKTFYLLNRAANYSDYREALKYFSAPAQNFIFASVDNDIAITVNGKFPLKYKDQGKYILDGSNPADSWQGWIPFEQNPTVKNPPQGFLSSANQSSTDTTYPYYINWRFDSYERGKRINDRLRAMKHATADSMRVLQNDNYSIFAQDILPTMLAGVKGEKMNAKQANAYKIISAWDKQFSPGSLGATIFRTWWINLYNAIWADDFTVKKDLNVQLKWPSKYTTVQLLLSQKNSKWYDDSRTQIIESRDYLIAKSFFAAIDTLTATYGQLGDNWQWGKVKASHIPHLGNVPGFGTDVFMSGGSGGEPGSIRVINALGESKGPSWRMVVQLGPTPQGYGVLPGGESGNPGSFYYDNTFNTWKDGKLNPLEFYLSPADKTNTTKSTLTLSTK